MGWIGIIVDQSSRLENVLFSIFDLRRFITVNVGCSRLLIVIYLLTLCILHSNPVFANQACTQPKKPITILYFRPSDTATSFWGTSDRFAEAVANDLNINLRTVTIDYEDQNRFAFSELLKTTLDNLNGPQPDFIISILYNNAEYSQLSLLNQYGIPHFTINTSLDDKTLQLTGKPRETFPHWKAHMSPNELLTGQRLVAKLADAHPAKTMAILAGSTVSAVSKQRVKGAMMAAKALHINAIPAIHTDWTKNNSIEATKVLIRRVSNFDLLVTVSPLIAEGAVEVISKTNMNVAIGSFDWSQSNIELMRQGKILFSYGGHFMETGWAIALIYDYLNGLDFINDTGSMIYSELGLLDSSNVDKIAPLLVKERWEQIDYKQFSKCANKSLKKYNFTLHN